MTTLKEEFIKRLGTVPDRVLAEEAAVSLQSVFSARQSRKIEPCHKHTNVALKKLTTADYATLIEELGSVRDSILARRYDVSREYVRQLRVRYRIPKFSRFIVSQK